MSSEYPDGAKWTCESLSSGFVVTREYGEEKARSAHVDGLDGETILWDFCKWLMDVRSIDDHITISFERSGKKFIV